MSRPFLARMLTPEECSTELSTILEAKWLSLRSLPAPESPAARVAREAAEAYTREVLAPHLVAEGYGEELLRKPSEADGIERRDSWDVEPEEIVTTGALPLEVPQFYGRDRSDWDEHDDKSDLSPHTREGKP